MLFRHTTRETQKRNLLLFLTPYIVREPSDLRAIFERKMRERQEFLDRYGMRLSQLGTILSLVAFLAEACNTPQASE